MGCTKLTAILAIRAYIGETSRDLSIRVKEHTDDLRLERDKAESGIVNHNKETGHSFDFGNARVIFPCKIKRKGKLLSRR